MVGLEDYLLSVISSEMSASASEEFLKAHAVISRSWVMARIAAQAEDSAAILSGQNVNAEDEYIGGMTMMTTNFLTYALMIIAKGIRDLHVQQERLSEG